MKIVMFNSVKGGISKTFSSLNAVYELGRRGKKVLAIDADLQANLTDKIYKKTHEDKTLLDAVMNEEPIENLIVKAPNPNYPTVDLIPAGIYELSFISEHIAMKEDKEQVIGMYLAENVEVLEKYDYIFVDLAPSIDILSRNFIYIADSLIMPLAHGDEASLDGAVRFLDLLEADLENLGMEDNIVKTAFVSRYNYKNNSANKKFMEFLHESEAYEPLRDILMESKLSESQLYIKAKDEKLTIQDMMDKKEAKKKRKVSSKKPTEATLKKKEREKEIAKEMSIFIDELIERGAL